VIPDLDDVDHGECPPHVPSSMSCLDEESFGSEDQLWKAVIEGVGNYLIVSGLCLCNSVIVNTVANRLWRVAGGSDFSRPLARAC
jgi:hypothetical protein